MSTPLSDSADHTANRGFVYGHSPTIQTVNAVVGEIARTDIPVLLMGESGTGKEVYGRFIHRISKKGHAPLRKLNCRALQPGELLAQLKSDLRGSGEGSESDARTLFLDGIDELDLACQTILLSFLPDGDADLHDHNCVRLIASTSRNLEKEIESGRFRTELYFRISGVCLRLPALRDRREDILPLTEHFLTKCAAELGRKVPALSDKQAGLLARHGWPGNIRELENLARKIVVLGDARKAMDEVPEMPKAALSVSGDPRWFSLKVAARAASRQAERDLISKVLERTHSNRKRAAQQLQISYKSLLYKIKQTGLEGKQRETGVKERQ